MKTLITSLFALSLALPFTAAAATFVVSPSSGSYKIGDTVTLNVSVNPGGSPVYTAMLDARFSPATFEVVSFTLNDALLPLKQSGYDALDNSAGILTKTGGYTSGISTPAAFGTIVLRAKAAGTATFTVSDSSKLLDSNNQDLQGGDQTASFAIATPALIAPTSAASSKPAQATSKAAAQTSTVASTTSPATTGSSRDATSTQVAATAETGSTALWWLAWLISLVLSFGAGYIAGTRR